MGASQLAAGSAGFFLGAGLIMAIGAQNAYILRQGLLRQHVFVLCLICALADALLIVVGIAGLGTLVARNQALLTFVTLAGAAFLFAYALIAARRALAPSALRVTDEKPASLRVAVATVLAFTFLNPHVYLDTVVLVGGLSAQYQGANRVAFGAGAVAASFVWFFTLGYGARVLTPIFAKPAAWRALDCLIALIMAWLGLALLMRALG